MSAPSSIEDHRGVDRAAIRELLQLTPAQRVQRLVDVVAVWSEILDRASDVEIAEGLRVRIAALDDVIASKRAAGRAKDLAALPYLESLRDELDSSPEA